MAPPVLHHLTFLFSKTSISLSLPPSTQITSLPSLLLPALALTSLDPPPTSQDDFRVCKRVETAQDDVWDFRPLAGGTTLAGKVGIWETLFLQFRDPSSPDDWLPVDVTPPTNDEEDEEDAEIEVPPLDGDADMGGKGKGRGF